MNIAYDEIISCTVLFITTYDYIKMLCEEVGFI